MAVLPLCGKAASLHMFYRVERVMVH